VIFRPTIETRPPSAGIVRRRAAWARSRFASWTPGRRSVAFDLAFAGSLTVLVCAARLVQGLRDNGGDVRDVHLWLGFGIELACGLALLVRRTRPVPCAVIIASGLVYEQVLAGFFAAYAVTVYATDRRRAWLAIGTLCVAAAHPWDWRDLGQGLANVFALLTPVCFGLYIASRRRLFAALAERAERAEREQELRAEQARAEERNRLAGDMHDIVTHRVSLMVLQAGAMRVRAVDEATRDAAEDLRATGCQALAELRDLVAMLRTAEQHGTSAPVEPAVLDLSELVDASRAAGVEVRLDAPEVARAASPVVVRTAYRVAQEALTNVHKHAPGARVHVAVAYEPDHLRLSVVNSAATRPCEIELGTGGTGLLGLQRRIELTGGSFVARPTTDGGFELVARLPVVGPEAPTRTGEGNEQTSNRTSDRISDRTPEQASRRTPESAPEQCPSGPVSVRFPARGVLGGSRAETG
jgi:signal transduction histidine kinase